MIDDAHPVSDAHATHESGEPGDAPLAQSLGSQSVKRGDDAPPELLASPPGETFPSDAADDSTLSGDSDSGDSEQTGEATDSGGEAEEPAPKPSRRSRLPVVVEEPPEVIPPKDWYILKVQSNRENSIKESLERRIAIAGVGEHFDQIIVPTEEVVEFKNGKKRVVERKLYPGYLVVHMSITEDTWFLVRETPGIGDFTGAGGKPSPMLPHEVSRIISKQEVGTDEAPKLKINFNKGDRVKIKEGTFENFEGDVDAIDEANGRVTVMINIFGRSTPVELEYWQIETV